MQEGNVLDSELSMLLNDYGILFSSAASSCQFSSVHAYFSDFTVLSTIEDWDQKSGEMTVQGAHAHFPDVALRIKFRSNTLLLVYPSGHIRLITQPGFHYYASLTNGLQPTFCQGDVTVFQLGSLEMLPHRNKMRKLLPPFQGGVWCHSTPMPDSTIEAWNETEMLIVGGNKKHCLYGPVKYCVPVRGDHRTIQIIPKDNVFIQHSPVDRIHPTIYLQKDRSYLVTKMPGFSNPGIEYEGECHEVSK